MTSPSGSVQSQATSNVAPSSANATTAAAAVSSNPTPQSAGATKVSSLQDLKQKAPEVYDQMMVGIATMIIKEMKHHQDHLKEIGRKYREDAGQQ